MTFCGADNPDAPGEYTCELLAGHGKLWRYGAWQDHAAPSKDVWWTVPPYTDDEAHAVSFVVKRATANEHVADLLTEELERAGWRVSRTAASDAELVPDPTVLLPRVQSPPTEVLPRVRADGSIDHPDYRAEGYTVYPARKFM